MKLETIQKNPNLLIRKNGLAYGISYVPQMTKPGQTRGAVIRIYANKKDTLLGFGITPAEFEKNYARAVEKLAEFVQIELTEELRKRLLETKYAFLDKYGIKTKQITVFDFINLDDKV